MSHVPYSALTAGLNHSGGKTVKLQRIATGMVSTPEIAQFALGDSTFKVHPLHSRYPSTIVLANKETLIVL